MLLSEICIRKPVFAIAINLALMIVGLYSLKDLEVRYLPKESPKVANIYTNYSGASNTLIEETITDKIESVLSGVSGIEAITSYSYSGGSSIDVTFRTNKDLEDNIEDVRDKVAGIIPQLPANAKPPYVTTLDSAPAVLNLAVISPGANLDEVGNYVNNNIIPALKEVDGVGGVWTDGASNFALRIWLSPEKMAALNIEPVDIKNALQNNNISFSAGTIRSYNVNYPLISDTKLKTVEDFKNLIIRSDPGKAAIKLQDVANVVLGTSSLDHLPVRVNGVNAVQVNIKPRDIANPITVANQCLVELAKLEQKLPPGMSIKILQNNAKFLENSLQETTYTIFEAILLVVIVVYLFLGSVRASLIPIITIPVCLITVFAFINLIGFTINIMTLLALVLSIGLVVDDAIVMLENIHLYIEQGLSSFEAALKGSKQITFAIIAMTITLAAVYAPIGFAKGVSAEVFRQFAFTLAMCVVVSGFVALTLSPMMCAYLLNNDQKAGFSERINVLLDKLVAVYRASLKVALQLKSLVALAAVILLVLGVMLFYKLPASFLPENDNRTFSVSLTPPDGTSIEYDLPYLAQVESIIAAFPEVKYYYMYNNLTVVLKSYAETQKTTQQVINEVNKKLSDVAGLSVKASMQQPVKIGASASGVMIFIMGNESYQDLKYATDDMIKKLQSYPGMINFSQFLKFNQQDYELSINRDLAASMGIAANDIAEAVSIAFAGMHITDLQDKSNSYPVEVQVNREDLTSFATLEKIFLRVKNADPENSHMVPLSSLVKLTPVVTQGTLIHYQGLRATAIYADLAPGYSMGNVAQYLEQELPNIIPNQYNYAFSSGLKEYVDSSNAMLQLVILSLLFIYLVLSVQFESFIDPFIILTVVPFSIIGAIFALSIAGSEITLFTNIGFITLIGLIAKHGILITQFTNELRQNNVEIKEALLTAASQRLRPILMTTLAMVLGTVPLVLSQGAGSLSRNQIGITIVGGLSFGTLCSLYIVPVTYLYFDKLRSFLSIADLLRKKR